jgi:undecaprenyl-diphosphatase
MTPPLTPHRARVITKYWPVISGGIAVLLAIVLGALVAARSTTDWLDAAWLGELVEHRSPIWTTPSLVMNFLGGGWFAIFVIPIGGALVLLILKRPWSALYFVLCSIASALVVHGLKILFARARPVDILVSSDFGSFPSGHTANAATIAVVLGLLLRNRWVWIAGAVYTAVMALSRTYLGAHWLTDTIGGVLLGAGIAALIWAPFAQRLRREWSAAPPHDSVAS